MRLTPRRFLRQIRRGIEANPPKGWSKAELRRFFSRHDAVLVEQLGEMLTRAHLYAPPFRPELGTVVEVGGVLWQRVSEQGRWNAVGHGGELVSGQTTDRWLGERSPRVLGQLPIGNSRAAKQARWDLRPLEFRPRIWTPTPLVLGCSATKRPGRLPAREKYDGSLWRTLRANPEPAASVWALSALHGIFPAHTEIGDYDACLTGSNTAEGEVAFGALVELLTRQVRELHMHEVVFVGGRLYADALKAAGVQVTRLSEKGIGWQRHALGQFLRERESAMTLSPDEVQRLDAMTGHDYAEPELRDEQEIVSFVLGRVDLATGRVPVTPEEERIVREWLDESEIRTERT